MVERLDFLTPEQEAQLGPHAARWIEIGLCTQAADRTSFEEAARCCYEYAGIPWPAHVIWVSSPRVLALTVFILQSRLGPAGMTLEPLVRQAVLRMHGEEVWAAVRDALSQVPRARRPAPEERGLMPWAAGSRVARAIVATVRDAAASALCSHRDPATLRNLHRRVGMAVDAQVQSTVRDAVMDIGAAVDRTVQEELWSLWDEELPGEALLPLVHRTLMEIFDSSHFILKGALDPFAPDQGELHPSLTSFLREVCALRLYGEAGNVWDRSHAYEQTMRSACWWYPHTDFVLVCERPREIHQEPARGRSRRPGAQQLHRENGPAMAWPDGFGVHAYHGRLVPGWVLEHPEAITTDDIAQMPNAEVRRVMIERYGWRRYIIDCGAVIVDSVPLDHPIIGLRGARLLRKELPGEQEPIVYLEMRNSTPAPDGSIRHYLERIDPKAYDGEAGRLCHAAMASRWFHRDEHGELHRTFARWQDYVPQVES